MRVKIMLVVYAQMHAQILKIIEKYPFNDAELYFYEGYLESIETVYKAWREENIDVIIATGGNFVHLNGYSQLPLVNIPITTFEYIKAIRKAEKNGKHILMPYYEAHDIVDEEGLKGLSEVPIYPKRYQSEHDLEAMLLSHPSATVIGGCLASEMAIALGHDSILLLPSEESVIHAIEEAIEIARRLKKASEKSMLLEAVLNYTYNGIIVIDQDRKIALINPKASQMLSITQSESVGKVLETVTDIFFAIKDGPQGVGEVINYQEKEFVASWLPFHEKGTSYGGVYIFQQVDQVIRIEQAVRKKHMIKGWVAKATFNEIKGNCPQLNAEIERAKLYARTDNNVFIYGETGVGKELFAQSIHNHSKRYSGPFVAVNCAAIPDALMESELFGYEEGAFTGSKKGGKQGYFEMAHGGTLFLDEIGEINHAVQARLLRVIQEKEVMRVGGEAIIPVDVRIISATNVTEIPMQFREDLYYRLDVLSLNIPSLKERGDDIQLLFSFFLREALVIETSVYPHLIRFFDGVFRDILGSYSWPGNIRELQSVVKRFALQCGQFHRLSQQIINDALIDAIGADRLCDDVLKKQYHFSKTSKDIRHKKKMIGHLNHIFPGRKAFVASKLGISRTTLWRMTQEEID